MDDFLFIQHKAFNFLAQHSVENGTNDFEETFFKLTQQENLKKSLRFLLLRISGFVIKHKLASNTDPYLTQITQAFKSRKRYLQEKALEIANYIEDPLLVLEGKELMEQQETEKSAGN